MCQVENVQGLHGFLGFPWGQRKHEGHCLSPHIPQTSQTPHTPSPGCSSSSRHRSAVLVTCLETGINFRCPQLSLLSQLPVLLIQLCSPDSVLSFSYHHPHLPGHEQETRWPSGSLSLSSIPRPELSVQTKACRAVSKPKHQHYDRPDPRTRPPLPFAGPPFFAFLYFPWGSLPVPSACPVLSCQTPAWSLVFPCEGPVHPHFTQL